MDSAEHSGPVQFNGSASVDDINIGSVAMESSGEESSGGREEEVKPTPDPVEDPHKQNGDLVSLLLARHTSRHKVRALREDSKETECVNVELNAANVSQDGTLPSSDPQILRKVEAPLSEIPSPAEPASQLWTGQSDRTVKLRMSESGPGSEPPMTVNEMFTKTVERFGSKAALAWKEGDTWKTLNYDKYYEQCRAAAKSFLKLGLERYHGVGILGFNSPEWFISLIGSVLAGGLGAGIYNTNSPEACQYVADDCKANFLVVENHKQLEKILLVQDRLPHLKAIIQYKDELKEARPNVFTWAEFMQMGEGVPDAQLDDIIASQKPNQCCVLIYTSGTTGQPKGVMLSHDNVTWYSHTVVRYLNFSSSDEVVSYLPLSHVAAQVADVWLMMCAGATTYFAQPDALKGSLANTLREVRPTAFFGVPRVWEKIQESMKAASAKSSTMRRKVAIWAKGVGLETNLRMMQSTAPLAPPMSYKLAKKLVFEKVRKALGLDRCTRCATGGAPISRETLEFFLSLDIRLLELYGMSESTGPQSCSRDDSIRLTSCGKAIHGCSTKIFQPDENGDGEICFWGRHVFMGYLNKPDMTAEVIDAEGWLHTGDLGRHDADDFLYITGRIKELLITAGGENLPPVPIEDAVKEALPLISNAMLIGDRRKFLSMLLTIKCHMNPETGAPTDKLTEEAVKLCQKLGSSATRVSEIAGGQDHAINAAIQDGINRTNARATSNAQRIQKWIVLARDFSIPGGELGPTLKLRRPVITEMYKEQIDNFYKDVPTPISPDNAAPAK